MTAHKTPSKKPANLPSTGAGQPGATSRIGCLLAAALMTTLCLGGQLGLARGYATHADAMVVAQRQPATVRAAIHPQSRGDGLRVCPYDALASQGGTVDEPRHQRADSACQRG